MVAGTGSFVDWRKEIQFVENRKKTMLDLKVSFFLSLNRFFILKLANFFQTTVIRKGKQEVIHIDHLHVGDLICLNTGDVVAVDGIVIQAKELNFGEAAMTGESDEMKKDTLPNCLAQLE